MKKKFDCVDMKHKAALRIRKEIDRLGKGKELEYWQKRNAELVKLKERMSKVRS